MRLTNKKKFVAVIIIFSCILLLGGWNKKKVELITDGKLIDLEKAIEMARIGVDETGQEEATEQQNESDNTGEEQKKTTNNRTKTTISIVVRGTQISFNGTTCKVEEISKMTRQSCTSDDKVRLLDDYAEAHVYHEVDDILKNLSESIGFEYDVQ